MRVHVPFGWGLSQWAVEEAWEGRFVVMRGCSSRAKCGVGFLWFYFLPYLNLGTFLLFWKPVGMLLVEITVIRSKFLIGMFVFFMATSRCIRFWFYCSLRTRVVYGGCKGGARCVLAVYLASLFS